LLLLKTLQRLILAAKWLRLYMGCSDFTSLRWAKITSPRRGASWRKQRVHR